MPESYSIQADISATSVLSALDSIIAKLRLVDSAAANTGQRMQSSIGHANVFSGLEKDAATSGQKTGQSFMAGFRGGLGGSTGLGGAGQQAAQAFSQSFASGLGPLGGVATALGPTGLVAAAAVAGAAVISAAAVSAASAWQSMGTSIGRTTGLEGKNLQDLMNDLQKLRMDMGVTREAAAGLVEQAGSIGVGQSKLNRGDVTGYKTEILEFAKATAVLQGAWGMNAEATAQGIGKMGSVTLGAWNNQRKAMGQQEESWADFAYKTGGQVDALANAMGSSEEEIVTAMKNASGAVSKWAPTEDTYGKWLALASTLIDTGASAGEAGTMIERASQYMEKNAPDAAKIMGIDKSTLLKKMQTDMVGTMQEFAKKIAAMPMDQRPDLSKIFGLEGKGLMDKLVADVEQGTGKLDNAIKIAMNPTNVLEGWDKVAAEASTQFERITQAAQVSLEKLGTIALPIVTDIAKGIADAWEGLNIAGSEIYGAFQGAAENASKGSLGVITVNGTDYEVGLSGIHEVAKKTEEEIANATEKGTEKGLASADIEEIAEERGKAWGEIFGRAAGNSFDQNVLGAINFSKLESSAAFAMVNAQMNSSDWNLARKTGNETVLSDVLGSKITWQKFTSSAHGSWIQIYEDGKQIAEATGNEFSKAWDSSAGALRKSYADQFRAVVADWEKALRAEQDTIAKSISDAFSDGIITFSERDEFGKYIKSIEEQLKDTKLPLHTRFELEDLKKQLQDAANNIPPVEVKAAVNLFEDLTTPAGRSKYFYENKEIFKDLTLPQGGQMADWVEANKENSAKMEALSNLFTGYQDKSIEGMMLVQNALVQLTRLDSGLSAPGSWLSQLGLNYAYYMAPLTGVYGPLAPSFGGKYVEPEAGQFWQSNDVEVLRSLAVYGQLPEKFDTLGGGILESNNILEQIGSKTDLAKDYASQTATNTTGIYSNTSQMVTLLQQLSTGKSSAFSGGYGVRSVQAAGSGYYSRGAAATPTVASPLWSGFSQVTIPTSSMEFWGSFATGGSFVTSGKGWLIAGESGPERVTVSPVNGSQPSAGNITTGSQAYDALYSQILQSCVERAKSDPSLKFTPSQSLLNEGNLIAVYGSDQKVQALVSSQGMPTFGASLQQPTSYTIGGQAAATPQTMAWIGADGKAYSYDPRNDTCDVLGFVAPDPSLKTTDKFYLGQTTGQSKNVAQTSWEYGGWLSAPSDELAAMSEELQSINQSSAQTQKNTQQIMNYGPAMSVVSVQPSASPVTLNWAVPQQSYGGGSSGIYSSAASGYSSGTMSWPGSGSGGYSYTSYGGMGGSYGSFFGNDWYTGGAAGLNQYLNRFSTQQVSPWASWLYNAVSYNGGSAKVGGNYGEYGGWYPSFAEGGDFVTDGPMPILVGEAGPERVQITPLGGGRDVSRGGDTYTFQFINQAPINSERDLDNLERRLKDWWESEKQELKRKQERGAYA